MSDSESKAPEKKRKAPPHAFKPGQSGNPGGLSKAWHEVRAAAQAEGLDCIRKLVELRDTSPDHKVQLAASQSLLDRGFGKPPVTVEDAEGNRLGLGIVFLPPLESADDADGNA